MNEIEKGVIPAMHRIAIEKINQIIRDEGACITINCNNPNAEEADRAACVDVIADFTNFVEVRFYGTTWTDALDAALDSKRRVEAQRKEVEDRRGRHNP